MKIFKMFPVFLVVFLFIFAPRLNIAGGVSAGMLAVLYVFVAAVFSRRTISFPRPLFVIFFIFSFLAIYSAALAEFYDNNPSYFLTICISVVISVVFGWFFAELLLRKEVAENEVLYLIVLLSASAIFINSLVVVLEYLVPPFKVFLESLLFQDLSANINYAEHTFRFRGFSSSGGAGLSIVNALGVILVAFLVSKRRLRAPLGILFALVMVVSNIFAGRTGLIFGIGFLLVLLLALFVRLLRQGVKGVLSAILLVLCISLLLRLALNFELNPEIANWAFEWVGGLTSGRIDSTSSDDLETMLFLPGDVVHLLFGIGFFEGNSPLYPRSDSGYVKTVLTIGALGGALLYGVIAHMFLNLRKYQIEFTWCVISVLIFMFIVEIKEPFLYQNFAARIIFLLSGAAMCLLNRQSNARTSYYSRA